MIVDPILNISLILHIHYSSQSCLFPPKNFLKTFIASFVNSSLSLQPKIKITLLKFSVSLSKTIFLQIQIHFDSFPFIPFPLSIRFKKLPFYILRIGSTFSFSLAGDGFLVAGCVDCEILVGSRLQPGVLQLSSPENDKINIHHFKLNLYKF